MKKAKLFGIYFVPNPVVRKGGRSRARENCFRKKRAEVFNFFFVLFYSGDSEKKRKREPE